MNCTLISLSLSHLNHAVSLANAASFKDFHLVSSSFNRIHSVFYSSNFNLRIRFAKSSFSNVIGRVFTVEDCSNIISNAAFTQRATNLSMACAEVSNCVFREINCGQQLGCFYFDGLPGRLTVSSCYFQRCFNGHETAGIYALNSNVTMNRNCFDTMNARHTDGSGRGGVAFLVYRGDTFVCSDITAFDSPSDLSVNPHTAFLVRQCDDVEMARTNLTEAIGRFTSTYGLGFGFYSCPRVLVKYSFAHRNSGSSIVVDISCQSIDFSYLVFSNNTRQDYGIFFTRSVRYNVSDAIFLGNKGVIFNVQSQNTFFDLLNSFVDSQSEMTISTGFRSAGVIQLLSHVPWNYKSQYLMTFEVGACRNEVYATNIFTYVSTPMYHFTVVLGHLFLAF